MKIRVENLGPIKNGEIDLSKKFYVFVGYNNTGKTYMAQVLWSVLDFWFENKLFHHIYSFETDFPESFDIDAEWTFNAKPMFAYYEDKLTQKIIEELNNENLGAFKLDLSDLYRQFNQEKIIYKLSSAPNLFFIFEKQEYNDNVTIKRVVESEFDSIQSIFERSIFSDEKPTDYLYDFITQSLNINDLGYPTFLPANRTFYPTFYRYIYQVAKEQKEQIDRAIRQGKDLDAIKKMAKRDYTTAMDRLTSLMESIPGKKPTEVYTNLLDELKIIMNGEIEIHRREGIAPIEFKFKFNGHYLDMHSASSSVNQLTALYLYLKYWASTENDFLIVDEPEENEHPKNQIALLNLLMKFANRNNNKVLITTHSPLITDAVNNHLHLGYVKSLGGNIDKIIRDNNLDIDPEAAMAHEDIGIYFFDGETIKSYEVGDYGVFFKDFKREEEKIQETNDILRDYIYNYHKQKLNHNLK